MLIPKQKYLFDLVESAVERVVHLQLLIYTRWSTQYEDVITMATDDIKPRSQVITTEALKGHRVLWKIEIF